MKLLARLSALCVLGLLTACGTGGEVSGPAKEPDQRERPNFVVPQRPRSLADRGGTNQEPPERLMSEQMVPLIAQRPVPLTREERADAEADALTKARAYLGDNEFGSDNDIEVTHVMQDPYGGLHVKMRQTYKGVPVLGTGFICHTHPERGDSTTAAMHDGIVLDVRPVVSDVEARAAARLAYGESFDNREVAVRLVVCPILERVKVRNLNAVDNTDDFEEQLQGVKLAYELAVTWAVNDSISPLGDTTVSVTDDATTEQERRDNALRGTQEEDESPVADFFESITGAPVRYLFDAMTGALISERTLIDHEDFVASEGTGHSRFNGTVPLSVSRGVDSGTYYLMDIVRPDTSNGFGNWVLDAGNQDTHTTSDLTWILDGNNIWGDGSIVGSETAAANSARRQTPATDVAYAIQMTWDFHLNVLDRWGPGGDGQRTLAAVHFDDGYTDAHYDQASTYVVFGDGSSSTAAGNYSLGTVAHELGHAFWYAVGNVSDSGEANALNEGNGDISGSLVMHYRGTGSGTGNQVRNFPNFSKWTWRLRDPDSYPSPGAAVTGQKYWSSAIEDLPQHVGGIPYGRAMIYLAEGAPSDSSDTLYTTEFPGGLGGIGPTFTAHIWANATHFWLAGTPSYAKMRTAWIDAAGFLYGGNSMAVAAVKRAFAAIRVGSSVSDTDNPQFLYAQVFEVDPKDMTAAILAIPYDDTGFRELRVDGHQNGGVYKGDIFLGYASITRAPAGTGNFTFELEDSAGKTVSVSRSFLKVHDRNLIQNGDFEDDMSGWTTSSGDDRVWTDSAKAFIGARRATMEEDDSLWQQVTIPATAENVSLVFRVLVRDSTKAGDSLQVQVQNTLGNTLQTLATYNVDNPPDTRDWINKGYLRQEFDLSDYAGLTIRIAFVNSTEENAYRFQLDQVVMTYDGGVTVGTPQVAVAEWDDTVSFTLPGITGVGADEIERVDWYIDDVFVGAGPVASTDYYGAYFLSSLTPGSHWVGGAVIGLDGSILATSQGVWFEPGPLNELLVNGNFEDGAWDLTYSDPAPAVQIVPNPSLDAPSFHGQNALKMGGLGADATTQAGQAVQMPLQMESLIFSVRVRVASQEDGIVTWPIPDSLWLELWDLTTSTKLGEFFVATWMDNPPTQGTSHLWRDYVRKQVAIPPGLVNGKNVMVRMFTRETPTKPTWFYVDNASFRYTEYGIQVGGGG